MHRFGPGGVLARPPAHTDLRPTQVTRQLHNGLARARSATVADCAVSPIVRTSGLGRVQQGTCLPNLDRLSSYFLDMFCTLSNAIH